MPDPPAARPARRPAPPPTRAQRRIVQLCAAVVGALGVVYVAVASDTTEVALWLAVSFLVLTAIAAAPLWARTARGLRAGAAASAFFFVFVATWTLLFGGVLLAPVALLLLVAALLRGPRG